MSFKKFRTNHSKHLKVAHFNQFWEWLRSLWGQDQAAIPCQTNFSPWVRLSWWLHSFIFFWAKLCSFFRKVPSQKLTARPWKSMVGRCISFWADLVSGAMLVLGSVCVMCWCMINSIHMDLRIKNTQIFPHRPPKQAPRQLPCGQKNKENSRQWRGASWVQPTTILIMHTNC